MNGLSLIKRTAPVSRYIRAVNSAMVCLSRNWFDTMLFCDPQTLHGSVKAQNASRRHAAVTRQFTGKIQERLISARPANEGQAHWASVDRPCRDAHFRQARDARAPCQSPHPTP